MKSLESNENMQGDMREVRKHTKSIKLLVLILFVGILIGLIYLVFEIPIFVFQIPIGIGILIMLRVVYGLIKIVLFNEAQIYYNEDILISNGAIGKIKVNLKDIKSYEVKAYGPQLTVCLYLNNPKQIYKDSSFLSWFFINFCAGKGLGEASFPISLLGVYYNDFISVIEKNIDLNKRMV